VHQLNSVKTWCREVKLFDLASGSLIRSLTDDEGGGAAGSERAQRHHRDVAAFSPGDELLLWGNALWDPRAPRRLHRFDQFTDFSGGAFHPAGMVLLALTTELQRVLAPYVMAYCAVRPMACAQRRARCGTDACLMC